MIQQNALLSVYDKTGITDFAQSLIKLGWKIYSSGGTAQHLIAAGVEITNIAELAGGEAILGHRVVTLSRQVCAGYLAKYDETDRAEMEVLGLPYIDLVCCNLYPLQAAIEDPMATPVAVNEKTDIGGPTMLNGAAKAGRIVICNISDYDSVLEWLWSDRPNEGDFVSDLAVKAFATTSRYYAAAAAYHADGKFSQLSGDKAGDCKYGENPYQQPAALFAASGQDPLAVHRFVDEAGDVRSFINLTDVDSLLQALTHLAAGFELNFGSVPLMAVGVKHGNACGAAVGSDPVDVISRMIAGDKRAIFGGVVMTNFPISLEVAAALKAKAIQDPPRLFDGICAPSFELGVASFLERKGGKCRMMANPALANLSAASLDDSLRIRPVRGGFLTQPNYTFVLNPAQCLGYSSLNSQDQRDLILAWAIGCVSNSNTITLVRDGQLIGNGVGQQDRVGAAELAIKRALDAGHDIAGAVAWSDSFFPAPDGPTVLAKAGVKTIFASSGSIRDDEIVTICRELEVNLITQPDKEVRGFAKH